MPTYSFRCPVCGLVDDRIMPISTYTAAQFTPPEHCAPMERFFTSPDVSRAMDFLTSDAIYDGMRTLDGVDVSSRTKHRAYMKERGLTTMDDFSQQWQRDAGKRAEATEGIDPTRRGDVVEAIERIKAR